MNKISALAALAAGLFLLQGCDQEQKVKEEAATAPVAQPNVVEIRAVGMTFEGSSEIPSGWTTFKFVNASSMIHFALIDVPPEGITAEIFTNTAGQYFQDAMDAMNAGDEEAVNAAFGKFPAWIGDLRHHGGPRFSVTRADRRNHCISGTRPLRFRVLREDERNFSHNESWRRKNRHDV